MATTYKILGSAVTGSTRTFNTINNKVIATNVATLTTASAHSYAVGDIVVVAGVDSTHDGTHVVATVPTTTTFTYLSTTATQSTAAVSPVGVVYRTHNMGGVASANKYSTGLLATLTTGSAHGLSVNDWVRVEVGDANMDGSFKILTVPSTTTFTYRPPTSTSVSSTAVTTGAFGRVIDSSWTTLYSVPASTSAVVSTIVIANQTISGAQYRIATSATTSPTLSEIIVYDATVPANDSITLTLGITLPAAQKIMVRSNSPEISFAAYGSEIV